MPTLAEIAELEASSTAGVEERAELLRLLASSLVKGGRSPAEEAFAFVVPGRIEVLGKHTDYAGGRSLTCATEQGFRLVVAPRQDTRVVVTDVAREATAEVSIDRHLETDTPDWTRYLRVVVRRLASDFGDELVGADIAMVSDLPPASGMSSSSALVVGLFTALARVNALGERAEYRDSLGRPEELAGYLGAVENGYPFAGFAADRGVGTFGGSEDHTAIVCSESGALGQYSYAPVRPERSVLVPARHLFVVASSGVRAKKTGGALGDYNRLSSSAAAAADVWRRAAGGIGSDLGTILESGVDPGLVLEVVGRAGTDDFTGEELAQRVRHFDRESRAFVPQAADALEQGDLAVFGLVVDRSQALAERLLGNQIPETRELAEGARELGAVAASAFGAGFGGAVWALVEEDEAEEFAQSWLERYLDRFPEHEEEALALVTGAAESAAEVIP